MSTKGVGRSGRTSAEDRLAQLLEERLVRIVLAVLIIISVLPLAVVEETFGSSFLFVFGTEFLLRAYLFIRGKTPRTRVELAFLFVDFLAVISFLPLDRWFHIAATQSRWLRWLRLARLLVLLRYTRALARDVYSVLTRREQLQQFGLLTVSVGSLAFVSAIILSQLRVPHDYDQLPGTDEEDFIAQLWWSFRQVESPDNLVTNLSVEPELAILSLSLTILGVFLIAYLIGIGTNVVDQVMLAERRRPVGYRAHSVVVGPVHGSGLLIQEFVRIFNKNRTNRRARLGEAWNWLFRGDPPPRRHSLPRMALLGAASDPPEYLFEPGMRWVVYREGLGTDAEALGRVAIEAAKRVILLAPREVGIDADAVTIASLAAVREVNAGAHVFAEVLESESEALVERVGGEGTFPLDVPRFLGLFLTHHLIVPGVDELLRELLAAQGSEFYTHIYVDEREHRSLAARHGEVVDFAELAALARESFGVSLAGLFIWDAPIGRTPEDLIPVDRLHAWLNPRASDFSVGEAAPISGAAIPVNRIGGLIGITSAYEPLRSFARRLLKPGAGCVATGPRDPKPSVGGSSAGRVVDAIRVREKPIRRVLIVGYSPALGSLLAGLASFVPGVEIILALSARQDAATTLLDRLLSLQISGLNPADPPGRDGGTYKLHQGGLLTLYTHKAANLSAFVADVVSEPVEAAVFLSDPESLDRDARTTLRVLRFAASMREGVVPAADQMHLLVELQSLSRGSRLREQLLGGATGMLRRSLDVSLVSTDQIRNYFLVHSAFVPGITAVYTQLLVDQGAEIVRLPVAHVDPIEGAVTLESLQTELTSRACLAFALQLKDGRVVTNPPPDQSFAVADLAGIFVLAERANLHTGFQAAPLTTRPPPDDES